MSLSTLGDRRGRNKLPFSSQFSSQANQTEKRQIRRRKAMQTLFDVNFLLDMRVFLERNEDPRPIRLESLYINFFFRQYTIFYKNNKLWRFDQTKEKAFRFPRVVNVGIINIWGKLTEDKGHLVRFVCTGPSLCQCQLPIFFVAVKLSQERGFRAVLISQKCLPPVR